jgi:hypothetical protein
MQYTFSWEFSSGDEYTWTAEIINCNDVSECARIVREMSRLMRRDCNLDLTWSMQGAVSYSRKYTLTIEESSIDIVVRLDRFSGSVEVYRMLKVSPKEVEDRYYKIKKARRRAKRKNLIKRFREFFTGERCIDK